MAIYFNNKILEPKLHGNSLEKRYESELTEVKELFAKFKRKSGEPSMLVFTRDVPEKWNRTKTKKMPAPPISLPLVSTVYLDDIGSVQIRYSPTPPNTDGNGKFSWGRSSMMFGEMTAIEETQMDLAWFLIKGTTYLKTGILRLVDKKQQMDADFDKLKIQAKPYSLLFSDDRTKEQLLAVANLVLDRVDEEATMQELAINIWAKVKDNDVRKEKFGFRELEKAIVKEIDKSAHNGQKIVLAGENDGENKGNIEVALKAAPQKVTREQLVMEATELGITVTDEMTKNVIFTLIEQKRNN